MAFEAVDPRQRRITCRDGDWAQHVVAHHPETAGWQCHAQQTIEDPDTILQDRDFPDRQIYYRIGMLPGKYARFDLKVVVKFEGPNGVLLTAYPVKKWKQEGDIVWIAKRGA